MAAERGLFWWTIVVVQVVLLWEVCGAKCPDVCSCLGAIVDCSKSDITQVPPDLPLWVEEL